MTMARVQAQHGPDKASSSHVIGLPKVVRQVGRFSQVTNREKCLKLVHRSLVSLILCIRLDVRDQH